MEIDIVKWVKSGRFGQRSRFVKVDFAFSLVKSEVQVALYFEELPYNQDMSWHW
jgi:hypothetical protein